MDNPISNETKNNTWKFVGIDRLFFRLRAIESLLGLGKVPLKIYANSEEAKSDGLDIGEFYITSTGSVQQVV